METWDKLPLEPMDKFAEKESYSRHHYRPIYSIHKWWARRPGSTFRILSLAAFSDEDTSKDDILRRNQSGSYDGLYFNHDNVDFSENTVIDPFAGGGTTLIEANRLGADVIGYELNPVAWYVIKKSIDDVDLNELEETYQDVVSDVREEVNYYFETNDPNTGESGEILYTFLCQKLPCLTCGEEVRLFPRHKLAENKSNAPAALYCPNADCSGNRLITFNRDIQDTETCPDCGHEFDPSEGNAGRGKYTCQNGHKHDIKETLQRLDEKPDFDRFAIQYKTRSGKNKQYKALDDDDKEKLSELDEKYQQERDDWLIPTQPIPDGDKTKALLNYNYERFEELYTPRQLYTFSKLFQRAKAVENDNISEFIILAISNCLRFNSKLCTWDYRRQLGVNVFKRHAFVPRAQPIEGNPVNELGGRTSINNFYESVVKGKKYAKQPFEKIKNTVKDETVSFEMAGENVSSDRLLNLQSKTAERIEEDDESVDYVITDPPYYDNVQYSELSDYFYSWLHHALGDRLSEFEPELVPKAREIVANQKAGKDEQFFIDSLSNVFSECYRVLKDDGEMVFTYHHNENEAWSVILEAIIESGFTVTAAYPVQSERSNNPHITDLDNAEYDILIFANKAESDEETTLGDLRQDLFFELQEMIETEQERHQNLSEADLGVILRGKCMFYYSKHYPDVYSDGEKVGIDEALDTVDDVIQQVVEGSANLPRDIDAVTKAYAAFTQRGFEDYDQLNKHLLAKNLNVSDLEDEKLVKGPRNKKEPVTADERINYIESKLNSGSGPQQTLGNGGDEADNLLDIDKVHYLYHLYKTDQNTVEYLKEWKTSDLEDLADFMADVTGDERYERVMEMGLGQF
jgi:adenine-specific DNA methylase